MLRRCFSPACLARCCFSRQELCASFPWSYGSYGGTVDRRAFSTGETSEAVPSPPSISRRADLTAAQRQQLDTLLYKMQRPATLARKVAVLGAMAATYRDLYVAVDSLYRRNVMNLPNPLLGPYTVRKPFHQPTLERAAAVGQAPQHDSTPQANPEQQQEEAAQQLPAQVAPQRQQRAGAAAGRLPFPVVDVSLLPDGPEVGMELQEHLMDTQAAWAQLQPSHIEMSHQLLTAVNLFAPSEACYPTHVDFAAAMRLLDHHKSRKRMRLLKRLLGKQDKYQIKAHGHYSGQA